MKIIRNFLAIALIATTIISCEKEDEGKELKIELKSGEGYTSASGMVDGGAAIKIGIEAETEKKKDPIIKFNISESINGGTASTVYTTDLETTDYEYDYNLTMDTVSGNVHKYTFTITNRDGFNAQESIVLTVK